MSSLPNIILINCDDLGYGDLGCYGSPVNRTPNIDCMASEGLKLNDFYMASPVCSPSRGAMMTGCYPRRIGFGSFDGRIVLFPASPIGLNPNEITIAKLLKQKNYRTKLIGKWHCGDQPAFLPTAHGFDEYYGLPYSNDMGRQYLQNREGEVHLASNPPLPLMRNNEVIEAQPDQCSLTSRYTEEAVRFLRENKDRPFFLYLAHMHTHLPLLAPEIFNLKSQNGTYGACVEEIDWSCGVLFHELTQLGLDENTLVVFTSDNGSRADHGGSNSPLRANKTTTYEGGQRVPCILRWKGVIPAGSESSQILASIDFYATFAALTGISVPDDRKLDTLDASDFILHPETEPSPRNTMFFYRVDCLEAVRKGDWKLHILKNRQPVKELYNLSEDISESRNLYDARPDIVSALTAEIEACRADLGDDAVGVPGNVRPAGRVENPVPLTVYDENHPYITAIYDTAEAG